MSQYPDQPGRQHQDKQTYGADSYYVNQTTVRGGDFQLQAETIGHEQAPQAELFDRTQLYDTQRVATEWPQYRSSVQTPQAMSAEFASTIHNIGEENPNGWSNPHVSSHTAADDGNIHLW